MSRVEDIDTRRYISTLDKNVNNSGMLLYLCYAPEVINEIIFLAIDLSSVYHRLGNGWGLWKFISDGGTKIIRQAVRGKKITRVKNQKRPPPYWSVNKDQPLGIGKKSEKIPFVHQVFEFPCSFWPDLANLSYNDTNRSFPKLFSSRFRFLFWNISKVLFSWSRATVGQLRTN